MAAEAFTHVAGGPEAQEWANALIAATQEVPRQPRGNAGGLAAYAELLPLPRLRGAKRLAGRVARCSDCGFMAMPGSGGTGWLEIQNTDFMPRTTPVVSRFCFRKVPGFDYAKINDDRECSEYMKYEPNVGPLEHFHLRE